MGVLTSVFNRILIVCIGNICRSPTAEFLFRDKLKHRNIHVSSAGLKALVGRPMDDNAMQILKQRGIDASGHRARQLEQSMLRDADLVLAMERSQLKVVSRVAPEASGKLFLLDKWHAADDVPDPYRQSREAFEHVHAMIERGVESWLRYI
jgi:protein-tyrosine phosphatase